MARAISILALTLAIVASVFAIWPVVAEAPWEDDTAPAVAPVVAPVVAPPSRCEELTQQLTDTQTDRAADTIYRLGLEKRCWSRR